MGVRFWSADSTSARNGRRSNSFLDHFLLRWILAVAVAVMVAGCVEYVFAAAQLKQRIVEQSTVQLQAELPELERVLSADIPPEVRRERISQHLEHLASTEGTEHAELLDSSSAVVSDAGSHDAGGDGKEETDAQRVRSVAASQRPLIQKIEEGDVEGGRYEFLLPVSAPEGTMVLVVHQDARVIAALLDDMRLVKVAGLLIAILLAVPLSYFLGGRALHRRQLHAEQIADTDPLTGLAGRRPFRPALDAALEDTAAGPVALALIDIDAFKQVNDRLGHSYGDRVLTALAASFEALRASDTAFRIGGDEFAVVLTGTDDDTAVEVVERVRRALNVGAPGITFSCGVAAAHPGDAVTQHELWERCDAALYEAKRQGRNQTMPFTVMSDALTVSVDKLDAVADLLAPDSSIAVAFQPIWDLHQGTVLGHEALLRLPPGCPVEGPQEAFQIAERLGIVGELDARARHAILEAVRGQDWPGLMFINIHTAALASLDLFAFAAEVAGAGLEPADVILEVSEQGGLDHPEPIRALKQAREMGFRLALDDMGQGSAGLRALTHVRFDVVKIDRSVVAKLGTDPASDATVAAAATFVQRTGGWVIAEGIEDLRMLNAVLDGSHGPTYTLPVLGGQGYLLGMPAPTPVALDAHLDVIASNPSPPPTGL